MQNIYVNSKPLEWRKLIKFGVVALLFGILFIYMDKIGILNNQSQTMFDLLWSSVTLLVVLKCISPKLAQCILNEFSIREKTIGAIIVPIIVGLSDRVLTNVLQVLPYLFGGEIIGIAKGQLSMESFNLVEKVLIGSVLGPFTEEVIFRIVFFTTVLYIAGYIDNKFNKRFSDKVYNLKSILCWVLIIINGVLFSLFHEPDISNFHLYFTGGIAYAIVYIKYGFFSAWLSHGIYNLVHLNFIFSLLGI